MRNSFNRNRKKFFLIPIGGAAILALISFVVMQLWNHLLPDIMDFKPINFWQAMGLFILCKILFGFGGKGGGAPWMRRKHMMEERFRGMSAEDRERFKEQMKNRCGSWGRRMGWTDERKEEAKEATAE
jgi:hypothetical protein